jgi:hypothetical protein
MANLERKWGPSASESTASPRINRLLTPHLGVRMGRTSALTRAGLAAVVAQRV